MFSRFFCVCCACWLLSLSNIIPLRAQQPAIPVTAYPVRSVSPADQDFTDLEFLRSEIGNARVVLLGEPTHGEGNVTEAKIRLLRFLQTRMGFTTVAFESGFYELDRAQRAIEAGEAVRPAVENAVFPVWTSTQEFQAVLPLLGRNGLRLAGFDCQLTGEYKDDLVEELEHFLKPEQGAAGIAYDYLDECLSTMGEHFIFPPTHQLPLFELQLGKARRLLEKVAAQPDAQRRERARFWLQTLRSLQALARDYVENDPSAKGPNEFKAQDSNGRDAQMADNLLWYLRQHPNEKVVCWAALGHFANKVETLQNEELKSYRPMGRAVKAALGPDAVYILGTTAGSGSHGFGGTSVQEVPAPAAGSLEHALLAQGGDYAFVSLKHDMPGTVLTTYAFDYQPVAGPWSEVVDGLLFLKSVNPPHGATAGVEVAADSARPAAPVRPVLSRKVAPAPAAQRLQGATVRLRGVVLDGRTKKPVPFATAAVPAQAQGVVADAQGRFELLTNAGAVVQVSCVGYEATVLTARAGTNLVVSLKLTSYSLDNVHVSAASQNPKKIMQRVIKAAATNYEQQDYQTQTYTHRRIIDFDTLRGELEYTSDDYIPAGMRRWAGGFLMLGGRPTCKAREKHIIVPTPQGSTVGYAEGGHGFSGGYDPIRISTLFKAGKLGRFALRLDSIGQHAGETYYLISFAAKKANHRSTDMGLTAGYAGRVLVRQQDYAVVRYEAQWQYDTVQHNAVARKYQGRKSLTAHLYNQQYTTKHTTHLVTYRRDTQGKYAVVASVAQSLSIGRTTAGRPFYTQKYCEVYPSVPVVAAAAAPPEADRRLQEALWQLKEVTYRPEFWQTYQRPAPAEPAPALRATTP